MGSGYNIPISLSTSASHSLPQNVTSPHTVVFGNLFGGVGEVSGAATATNPTSAASAASNGGDASSQGGASAGGLWGSSTNTWLIVGSVITVGIIIGTILYFKK